MNSIEDVIIAQQNKSMMRFFLIEKSQILLVPIVNNMQKKMY